jgi:hypothetical protein
VIPEHGDGLERFGFRLGRGARDAGAAPAGHQRPFMAAAASRTASTCGVLHEVRCRADGTVHALGVAEFSSRPGHSVDGEVHALRAAARAAQAVFRQVKRVIIAAGVVLAEALQATRPRLERGVLGEVGQAERLQAVRPGQGEVAAADGNIAQDARRSSRDVEERLRCPG